jgi:ubiquinol-cytochrome c reductase cytochrome c subunit
MHKLILLAFTVAIVMFAEDTKPDSENGKRLYVSIGCYECHGRVGQGGWAGPRLAPRTVPLPVLVMYVRHPAGAMPPYTGKVVTDAQLADIHAFLKSIPPPTPAKDIPLLNH